MERGELLAVKAYGFGLILLAFFSSYVGLWYDVAVLVGLSYGVWRVSPTLFLTGKRVKLDDLIVVIGFILLAQQLFRGQYEHVSLLIGALAVLAFAFVVGAFHPIRKNGILFQFSKKRWLGVIYAFVCTWGVYVLVYLPLVTWLYVAPWLAVLFGVLLQLIDRMRRPKSSLFHTRKSILLGVSGLLVLHFSVDVLIGLQRVFSWLVLSWKSVLSLLGMFVLFSLPGYMWYTTYSVRKSHTHLPDWPVGVSSLAMALIVFTIFQPVFVLRAGLHSVTFAPTSVWSPYALYAAVGVFLVLFVIGTQHDFLRRVLMMGPFVAGMIFLGMYVFYAFVTEFGIVTSQLNVVLLPVMTLVFVTMVFFLVLGYLGFLYELWRD